MIDMFFEKISTMATKFYKCRHCGNVIEKVVDSGIQVVCCGENMQELIPNTVDASTEKHVPVVTDLGDGTMQVKVGSVEHPMLPEHHIVFIYVETKRGGIHSDSFLSSFKITPPNTACLLCVIRLALSCILSFVYNYHNI